MADVTNELIYHVLQRMQADIGDLKTGVREIRHRLGTLEMQMAGISNRMDRIDDTMERVVRRLELIDGVDAPIP